MPMRFCQQCRLLYLATAFFRHDAAQRKVRIAPHDDEKSAIESCFHRLRKESTVLAITMRLPPFALPFAHTFQNFTG